MLSSGKEGLGERCASLPDAQGTVEPRAESSEYCLLTIHTQTLTMWGIWRGQRLASTLGKGAGRTQEGGCSGSALRVEQPCDQAK